MCFWRLNNEEFNITRLQPTVKHGVYSVMVLGAIRNVARSELVECQGNITSVKYVPYFEKASFAIVLKC